MGASSWHYFVPYQEDTEQALQELRQQTFQDFDFWPCVRGLIALAQKEEITEWMQYIATRFTTPKPTISLKREQVIAALEQQQAQYESIFSRISIEQVLEIQADEGTHSILDIQHIGDDPGEYNIIFPLPREALVEYFGTEQPTHTQIEAVRMKGKGDIGHGVYYMCQRGIYIIVYKGDRPDEIYFGGCSGD